MEKDLKISDIKSLFVLARLDKGNYYPCLIIGNGSFIKNGFKVYFLRQDIETEVPQNAIIYNLLKLKGCKISYTENGSIKEGQLMSFDTTNYSTTPTCALIRDKKKVFWIPIPRLIIKKEQAINI